MKVVAAAIPSISKGKNKAGSDDSTGVIGPKQMWELACRRCAARAALDLRDTTETKASAWLPLRGLRAPDRLMLCMRLLSPFA
jgi:hypothetical protein